MACYNMDYYYNVMPIKCVDKYDDRIMNDVFDLKCQLYVPSLSKNNCVAFKRYSGTSKEQKSNYLARTWRYARSPHPEKISSVFLKHVSWKLFTYNFLRSTTSKTSVDARCCATIYVRNSIHHLWKKRIVSGEQKPDAGTVHVIQTTQVPLLIFVKRQDIDSFVKDRFYAEDECNFDMFVLLPHTTYVVFDTFVYVLATYHPTYFKIQMLTVELFNQRQNFRFEHVESYKPKKDKQQWFILPEETESSMRIISASKNATPIDLGDMNDDEYAKQTKMEMDQLFSSSSKLPELKTVLEKDPLFNSPYNIQLFSPISPAVHPTDLLAEICRKTISKPSSSNNNHQQYQTLEDPYRFMNSPFAFTQFTIK